jgi:hypothetical protein
MLWRDAVGQEHHQQALLRASALSRGEATEVGSDGQRHAQAEGFEKDAALYAHPGAIQASIRRHDGNRPSG